MHDLTPTSRNCFKVTAVCVSALLKIPPHIYLFRHCKWRTPGFWDARKQTVNYFRLHSWIAVSLISDAQTQAAVIVQDPDTLLSLPISLPALRLLSLNAGLVWTLGKVALKDFSVALSYKKNYNLIKSVLHANSSC